MPEGFLTEAGPRPDFAEMFGAVPWRCRGPTTPSGPGPRHRLGHDDLVRDPDSTGGRTTLRACTGFGKPVYLVNEVLTQPSEMADWIEAEAVRVLNVVGNRESTELGMGEQVERFLVAVFRQRAGR